MTLDQMSPQTLVQIVAVNGKGLLRRRLLEMGLTPHTLVKIRKVAPMGGSNRSLFKKLCFDFEERGCFFN